MATEKNTASGATAGAKRGSAKPQPAKASKTSKETSTDRADASKRPVKRASAPRADAPKRVSAGAVAALAARQLLDLIGKESEGITGLERTEDGWTVLVDVVELTRVPNTTDVLATYEVEVDERGELLGYRRSRRFVRGTAGGE
ncbi:gas vesicle protein [Nocardioides sp. LHG3406-4]|uniref:gas vesicle protein GvpO n=1 Tax=Nocardioides sp. LHG3406-4 TaxID=2804575 RepID=UPI003CF17E63